MARILIGNIKGPQGPQGKQGEQGIQGIQGKPGPLPPLTNTALATVPGISALDAVMGKTLQDQITKQNSDLAKKLNTADLARTFNKNSYFNDVTEFHISHAQFAALTDCMYSFNSSALNGTGGFGVVIPIASGAWRFWLGIATGGEIIVKCNINDAGWSGWMWFTPQVK